MTNVVFLYYFLLVSFSIIAILLFNELTILEKKLEKHRKVLNCLLKVVFKDEKINEEKIFEEFEVK